MDLPYLIFLLILVHASVAVIVVVMFLVLTRVIALVPILSGIPKDLRESMEVF